MLRSGRDLGRRCGRIVHGAGGQAAGGAQKVTFLRDAGSSGDCYIQSNGSSFNNLTLDDNGHGYDFILLGALDVDGDLLVEDGGLEDNGELIKVGVK